MQQPGDVFRRPVFVAGADANAPTQEHAIEPRAPAQAQAPVPQQQHHAPLAAQQQAQQAQQQAQHQAQQQAQQQQAQQQQQQAQQVPPQPQQAQQPQQVSQPQQPSAEHLPRLHVNVNLAGAQQQPQVPHQVASSFPQQGVMFPDIALFGQLDQAVPRISLVHPLHVQQGAATNAAPPPQPDRRQAAPQAAPAAQAGGGTGGKTRSQSDYASRHQAAEQRRRTRINERLDRLRSIVPHAERSNTATFLEQVYAHIDHLNETISTLKEGIVVRESRIQELLASGRPENNPQPIPESSKDPVNRASQVPMKDDPGVETGDVGVQANTVAETALPPVGEQWMGIKDGLKRSPIHTIQDPAKRLRA